MAFPNCCSLTRSAVMLISLFGIFWGVYKYITVVFNSNGLDAITVTIATFALVLGFVGGMIGLYGAGAQKKGFVCSFCIYSLCMCIVAILEIGKPNLIFKNEYRNWIYITNLVVFFFSIIITGKYYLTLRRKDEHLNEQIALLRLDDQDDDQYDDLESSLAK
eukprot:421977_1